jgi:hypothetical protein
MIQKTTLYKKIARAWPEAVKPETTKGAFRRPLTSRSACHRNVPAWLCDGWLPGIAQSLISPFRDRRQYRSFKLNRDYPALDSPPFPPT